MKSYNFLNVLLIGCLTLVMLSGMARESPEFVSLTNQLIGLRLENTGLKERLKKAEGELLEERIAQHPVSFFAKVGYFKADNPYARNPAFTKKVWQYIKKWEHLLDDRSVRIAKEANIDIDRFLYCWIFKETHLKPTALNLNKDGTYDYGLCQINGGKGDKVWDMLYARLPEELKKLPNPKFNPEVSIGMFYVWMNERNRIGMSWAYLTDWAWTEYWVLGNVINAK